MQHVDCVILDDGGFLLMSNQDEYISLVSNNQLFSPAYRYHGCQNICSHIFRLRQLKFITFFLLSAYLVPLCFHQSYKEVKKRAFDSTKLWEWPVHWKKQQYIHVSSKVKHSPEEEDQSKVSNGFLSEMGAVVKSLVYARSQTCSVNSTLALGPFVSGWIYSELRDNSCWPWQDICCLWSIPPSRCLPENVWSSWIWIISFFTSCDTFGVL